MSTANLTTAEVKLATKLNNCASNDPCALCGKRTDPQVGPELFLESSWALVCHPCGWKHAPELAEILEASECVLFDGEEAF